MISGHGHYADPHRWAVNLNLSVLFSTAQSNSDSLHRVLWKKSRLAYLPVVFDLMLTLCNSKETSQYLHPDRSTIFYFLCPVLCDDSEMTCTYFAIKAFKIFLQLKIHLLYHLRPSTIKGFCWRGAELPSFNLPVQRDKGKSAVVGV